VTIGTAIGSHLWRCLKGSRLLEELAEAGVSVRLDGAVLKAKGPVTPEIAGRIRDNRREIVAALKEVG